MILKRHNTERETHDRIEAAIMQAAGYKVIKAGGLDNRQLQDVSNGELKSMAALHSLTKEGRFADPNAIVAVIAPYLKS